MKKNSMSPTEYSINKNEINKIIDNIEKEQIKENQNFVKNIIS